ncbi:hypothetical protein [Helicobacter fennelliae]|nr:hypothetical protein [Helicobacter fennelliae]STP07414.1 Uncharacterised protein [Helicobacter fennelliae]
MTIAIVCCLLGSESSDTEWDKHRFISRKNLGFTLCLKEFYKDLPNEIVNADRLFGVIELADPDDKKRFIDFITTNINSYIPHFKYPELYPKNWYFVACLNMYNSQEYEDMIQRKGKYAK